MQWGSPLSFLFLLGAIPVILILHSLRPREHKVSTPALFLLERVRLGWLMKRNLLLILQLLTAFFLITALAGPSLLGYGEPKGDAVIVVDLSASMKARGHSASRFESARRAVLSFIGDMAFDQRIMVIGAGPTPRVLLPFTSDKRKARDLVRGLRPTDAPARVKEAILFAHSFLRQGSDDRVVVFSDGAFEGVEELPWNSAHLQLVRVEGGSDNVGIVGFAFRRVLAETTEHEIMVGIKNFSDRPVRAPLTLTVGEKTLVQETVEIAPDERRVLIYPYREPLRRGRATALLSVKDDFFTDNRAFLVLPESPVIRVLYAGKGNYFLEHLFRIMPQVQVTRLDPVVPEELSKQLRRYDVIVLDGIPAPPIVEGNFILINTIGKGLPLEIRGKVAWPRTIPWAERHPLSKGLRLDDLYIEEALRLFPLGEGITIARSKETPLIYAMETDRLKALVLGFDLLVSDLPFKVAFPMLFSNAFAWFRPGEAEFPAAQVHAGGPYTFLLTGIPDQAEVISPSGVREEMNPRSREMVFSNTTEVGFYTFRDGKGESEFAVNLLSEAESQIRPVLSPSTGASAGSRKAGESRIKTGFALWPFLLFLVCCLMVLEGLLVFRSGGSFFPLVLRLPALLAVILALVNPRIFRPTEGLDVVLGVDFSRSVGQEGKDKSLHILDEAQRLKGSRTRVGLLSFARGATWEFFPRTDVPLSDFSSPGGREETDIATALQAAVAHLGEEREGRVLLISDGNENRGEVSQVLPLLRSHGVQVWTLPASLSQGGNEIYLRDLVVPYRVDSAETFEIKGAIESLHEADARIKMLHNGVVRRDLATTLRPGTNWISFKEVLRERGGHTFELLVESPQDTLAENNFLQGFVEVRGPPRVLYLHSPDNSQRLMARALAVQGYEVVETSPDKTTLTLPGLSAFDLLVLDNLPAYRLSQAKMEAVEKYVKELGGGMVVIGGPESYGAGGYYRSPLERALPVEMRPPARLELPHVALLFVLDKSGSMGEGSPGSTKLDLAKAAAMASAELLNPSDQLGILAFDAGWNWVVPFSRVGKGQWFFEHLSSLQSDGGTDLYKAMAEANHSLSLEEAAVKHVLVLSDGLTDKRDFQSLVETMVGQGITVSTVSVGRDADLSLMAEIAKNGKGRGYVTVDPRTIPQIFTTETLLISRELLVEKVVRPKLLRADGPLKGFSGEEIPSVRGYVLTHPKPRSEVFIKVEDAPLLVAWRYGLGRVIAFTSDLSGRWGRDWVRWEGFPKWASQVARSALKQVSEDSVRTQFRQGSENSD
jgi:Mg-chelatase subunit ChlD